MHGNRLFISQETVDGWLESGRVQLEGDVLALPRGPRFRLTGAVVFKSEVASGEDPLGLCGKVKSLQEVEALSGEVVTGSVVIGDNAYETADGFLAELLDAAHGGEALQAVQRLAEEG